MLVYRSFAAVSNVSLIPARYGAAVVVSRFDERLRAARARRFAGRAAERAAFAAVLKGDAPTAVLWVCGPGGIGKSALLDQLEDDALAVGRPVIRVDGRDTDGSPGAFSAAVPGAADTPGIVVLADTFDRCDGLEGWLRRDFAAGLPSDALIVVASRHPPGLEWRTAADWTGLLQVMVLRDLPREDAVALLDTRDVPPGLRDPLLAFAGGHPLALSLAGQVAGAGAAPAGGWVPSADVLRTLVSALVGAVPSAVHQHVLQICAHAYDTSEELLRAVLGPEQDARVLFNWLCDQPFIEFGAGGVFPHDVIREVLDADLRWRDPQGYEAVHRGIRRHLVERIGRESGAVVLRAMRELSFLHRHGGVMPDFVTWTREEIHDDAFQHADTGALLALAAAAEGAESARIAGYWLSRQPGAFRVYRKSRAAEPAAFMAWLRLSDPEGEDSRVDPVTAAVWEHCRAARPLRPGEHIAVVRFSVDPEAYQRPSPVGDLVQMRVLSEWLRGKKLAWSYIVVADPDFWRPEMDYLDQHLISARPAVGGRSYGIYAHDWREVPVEPWLDRHVEQELFGPRGQPAIRPADFAVLSREEFDTAVRDALRSWRRPDQMGVNPLTRARLAAEPPGDPSAALRQALADAAGTLAQDPRTRHLHRAIAATFLDGTPTQEAAAERLGVPFSTYRRHLARGLREICDLLWSRELYGTAG